MTRTSTAVKDGNRTIAYVAISAEKHANALAAAPDLVAALKSAEHMLTRDYIDPAKLTVIEKCQAALAKAAP